MATRIVLDAKLDTAAVEGLRQSLLENTGKDVTLDGSSVEQMGGLCLELILSARHLWADEDKSISIESPSPKLVDDLGRFGLTASDFEGRAA